MWARQLPTVVCFNRIIPFLTVGKNVLSNVRKKKVVAHLPLKIDILVLFIEFLLLFSEKNIFTNVFEGFS